ncbi:pseudaminic acid synthase [Rhabdothermincola salaria]|uniref:pseudaminic acid synthase n=1 Tax=Rhabdothermincola salaria TaxID=2903142 RepID=UPI001E50F41B|nr:pseudaminic acid synthase [Rhabdothermincola salaria]MCD9622764.1 pseudaminic acid synthase [Rhabdothermincola salaria]
MSDDRLREALAGVAGSPCLIAEISGNHSGRIERALELVGAAASAGADVVKFQHYTPESMTVRSDHPDFQVTGGTLWDGRQLADLYAEAMTPWEWTEELVAECDRLGLAWLSTPFDPSAVDFLESFNPPAYKIASFEIVDLPLIRYSASKGRPLIISTGMATVDEIDRAVRAASEGGAPSVALLRCNSAYPADPGQMDLAAIPVMRSLWDVPVGLSDHTLTSTAAIAAVALGASIVEKHVTLRRSDGGPDAEFSLEPQELARLSSVLGEAHAAIGRPRFGPSAGEAASLAFRRSLRVIAPIAEGKAFSERNVRSVRPAGGLAPDLLSTVIGKRARRSLSVGDPLTSADVADE